MPDELVVGEPANFKRPKTKEGPVHTNAEWKAERALRADRYVQIDLTSKVRRSGSYAAVQQVT